MTVITNKEIASQVEKAYLEGRIKSLDDMVTFLLEVIPDAHLLNGKELTEYAMRALEAMEG